MRAKTGNDQRSNGTPESLQGAEILPCKMPFHPFMRPSHSSLVFLAALSSWLPFVPCPSLAANRTTHGEDLGVPSQEWTPAAEALSVEQERDLARV